MVRLSASTTSISLKEETGEKLVESDKYQPQDYCDTKSHEVVFFKVFYLQLLEENL